VSAESKKKKELIALSILGVGALYGVYSTLFAGPSAPAPTRTAAVQTASEDGGPVTMVGAVPKKGVSKKVVTSRGREDAFHPIWLSTRKEEQPDVTRIDPTLHLEYLAKVQDVDAAGGTRNLFAFGQPPPPKPVEKPDGPEPKIKPGDVAKAGGGRGGPPPPKKDDGKPGEVPLQINLKYYGIIAYSRGGNKTACFMDGEEILTATEGDTLKRRYRVVRIGPNSVVMEDTESKRQATLPIAQEAQG